MKRQASQPSRIDSTEEDPSTWNVSRLKAFLTENGVSFETLTEKTELVACAKDTIQKKKQKGGHNNKNSSDQTSSTSGGDFGKTLSAALKPIPTARAERCAAHWSEAPILASMELAADITYLRVAAGKEVPILPQDLLLADETKKGKVKLSAAAAGSNMGKLLETTLRILLLNRSISLSSELLSPPASPASPNTKKQLAPDAMKRAKESLHAFCLIQQLLLGGDGGAATARALKPKTSGKQRVCGKTLGRRDMVFRCLECAADPTCIMCAECFNNSPCINHEYRMAPSGGGMCDCGDPSAWKSQSFCRNHAGSSHTDDPTEALNPLDRVWISAALRAAALQCVVFIRYLVGAHTHQIKTSSSAGTVGFSSDDNETSTTSTGASGALAAYVSTDASFALSKPPSSPTSSSSTADIQRSTSHIEEAFREIMGMFKQLSSLGEAAARMVFDAVAAQQSLEPLFMPTHQSPSDNDNNNETIRVEFALPNLANFDTLSQEDKADFYTTSLFDELCREDARGFLQSKLGNSSTWGVVPQLVTALIPDMSCKLLVARSILKYIDIRARPTAEMMETIRRGVDYLKNSISTNAVQVLTVPWAAEESLYPEKFQLGPKTTGMHRLMTAFLYGLANLHVNSNASTFPPLSPPFTPSSGAPHAVMRYIKNIESLDSVVLHVVHEMRYLFYSSPLIGRYFATSEVLLRALCTSLLGAHVSDVVVRNEKYSSNSGRHSYFSWDFQLRIGSLHRELMKSVASINKDLPAESIDTIRSYSNAVLRLVILKKALACETSDQEEGMNQNDEKISKLLSQPEILQSILWSQEEDQIAECAKFKKTGHRGQKARATSSCEALADGSHSPPGVSASSKSLEKILDDVLPSQLRKLTEETKSLPRPSRDCIEKIDNLFESQLDKCSAVSKYPLLPAPMRIISSVVTCGRTTSGLLPLSDRVHYTKAIIEIIAFALNDVSYINNMSTAPAKKPLMARAIVSFGSNEHDSEPNNTAAEDNAAEEKSKAQASTKGGKSKKNSAKKKNGKGKQGKEEILAPAASTSLTKKMLSEPNTAILSHFCPIHEGHGTTFLVPLIRLLANVLNCFLFAEVTNPTPFLTVRETDDTSTTDSSSVSTAEIITPSDRRAVLLERLLLVCSPFTFNNNNKNNTASLSPTSPSSSLVHQLPSISIHDWIDMPLRAQVLKHQVEDQLWMRDYAEVQRQARLYEDFQPAAVIEMDLFALQVFSAVVGPQNLAAQMLTRYSYVPQHDRHDITQSPTGYAHFLDLVLSIVGDDNKSSCNRRRANANRILRAMATQGPMLHSQLMESINRQVEDEDDEGETQENSQALQEVIQSLTTSDLQRKGTMRKLVKDKSVWANISVYNINWDINDRESALKEYKLLFGSSSSANENGNNKSNNAAAIANSTSHSTEEFPRALLGQHHEALIDPIRALLHTAPTLSTAIYAVLHKAAEIQKQVDLAVAAAKGVTLPKTQYEIEREQMLKQQQQDKKKKGGGAASATNARPTTEQERLAQMLEALRAEVGGMMRGRQERGRGGNRGGARGRRNGNDENEDDDAESATTSSASSSSSEGDSDDDFDWDDVFGDNNDEEEDDEEETEWVNVDNSDAEQEEANDDDDDDDDDNDNRFSSDFDDEVETDMNKVVDRAVSVAKSTSSSSTSSSDEDDECDAPADHTTAANKAPSSLAKNNKKKSGQANNNNDSSRKKPAGDSKNKNNKKKMPAPIPFIKVNDTFLLTAIDFLLLSIEDAVAISKEEKVHEKRSAAKTSNSILSTLCGGEGEEHSVSQNAGNDEENCVDDGGVIDFSYFEQWHERVLKANPFNNNMSTTSGTADSENIVQNVSTSFNADFFLPLPELAGRKPHLYSLAKVPVVHSKILTLQTNVPSKRTLQHLIKGAHAAEEINERNGKNTTMPEVQKYRSYYHRYLAKVCRLQQQKEAESAAFDSPRSLFDVLPLLSKYFSLELEAEHPSFVKTTVDKAVAEVYLAKIKKIMTLIANEPKSKDGQDGTNAEDDAESKANAEKEAKAAADRAARIKEKQQLLLARMKKKQERASAAHQIADPTSAAASPTPGPTTSPTGAETDNAESASDALAKAPNMHESLMMKSTEAECCFCRLSDEGGELMWLCHASASSNVSDLRTHRGNEKRFAESYSDPNYTAGEISTLLSIPQSATSLENLPHYVDEKALNLIKRNNNSAVVHDHLKQLKASMGGLLLLSEEEQHDTITCCRDENNNAAVGGSSEASGSHGDRLSLYKYPFVVHRNTNDKNNGDEEETKINKKLKTAEPQSHRLSVSIMTCGHAAHMACVEKHHAYLNQQRGRDIRELHLQRRGFRGMEFLGGAEFCCPICTRIATVLSYIPKMINASSTSASSALLSSSTSSSSNNNNNSTATSYFDSHLPSAEGCFGEWVASSAIGNNPDAVQKRILETVAALPPKIALSKADENMSNKTFSDFIKINKNIFEKVAPMFSSALCRPYKALVTESASGFSRSADQNPIDERRVDAWTRILNFAAIRAVETEAFTHDLSRITIAEEEKKEEKGEESKKLLQQPLTGPTAASEVVANLPPAYLMNIVNFGLSMADNVCLTLEGKIKLSQEHSTSSRVSFALNEISPQIISNLATMMTTFSVCLFDENGSTIIGNATGDALDNYYYQRFSGQSVPSSPSSSLSPSSPSAVAVADVEITTEGTNHHQHNRHLPVSTRAISIFTKIIETFVQHKPLKIIVSEREEAKRKYLEQALLAKKRLSGGDKEGAVEEAGTDSQNSNESDNKQQSGDNKPEEDKKSAKTAATPIAPTATPPPAASMYYKYNPDVDSAAYGSVALPPIDPIDLYSILSSFTLAVAAEEAKRSIVGFAAATASCSSSASSTIAPVTLSADLITNCLSSHVEAAVADLTSESTFIPFLESVVNALTFVFPEATISAETKEDATNGGMPCVEGKEKEEDTDHAHAPNSILIMKGKEKTMVSTLWHFLVQLSLFKHILTGTAPPPTPVGVIGAHHHHQSEMSDRDKELVTKPVAHGAYLLPLGHEGSHVHNQTHEKNEKRHQQQLQQEEEEIAIAKTKVLALLEHLCPQLLANTKALLLSSSCSQETTQSTKGDGSAVKALLMTLRDQISRARNSDDKKSIAPLSAVAASFLAASYPLLNNNTKSNESTTNTVAIATPDNDNAGVDVAISSEADANKQKALITGGAPFTTTSAIIAPILPEIICGELTIVEATKARCTDFIYLPRTYHAYIRHLTTLHNCSSCGAANPTFMCLKCQQLLCLRPSNGVPEVMRHAQTCGGGVGIFIMLRSSDYIVVSGINERASQNKPVYVDRYGEYDQELSRGVALNLNAKYVATDLLVPLITNTWDHDNPSLMKAFRNGVKRL